MGTVYHQLLPEAAQFLAAAFPQYLKTNGSSFPVSGLAYDAAADEAAFWKFRAIEYGSGNITLDIEWYADTASSGTIVFEAQIAVITPNTDSQDIETKALATLNFVQDTHLGTVGQRLHRTTIALSNLDGLAKDDEAWLRLARDADGTSAADSMTGDGIVTKATASYLAA